MALFDFPLEELRSYRPVRSEPDDFDAFWQRTMAETNAFPLNPTFATIDARLPLVHVEDVRFNGFNGEPISGWFIRAAQQTEPGPCLVRFHGYGNGRWLPADWLLWPNSGYSILVMDTRGQGAGPGATPDPHLGSHPQQTGFMTRGILDPDEFFYRRVYSDAVRSVDAALAHPLVDPTRVFVSGPSQGGGVTQAVVGLRHDLAGALIDVPFLTHFRRAIEITDSAPYGEISTYLAKSREDEAAVYRTLDYFDGLNFVARSTTEALYSVGLMDAVCPPSTVYAAFNHYGAPAEMVEWKFNGHEGGGLSQHSLQLDWLGQRIG